MMRTWMVMMSVLALLGAASVSAQESRRDTSAAMAQRQPGEGGAPGGPQAPFVMPPIGQAALADPHNKLIHFPIVLGLLGAVMVLIAQRHPKYEPVAFWLVWFALLSTLAAYFSGFYQSTEFMHRPKRWLVETHERFAIGLAFAECVWLLALLRRGTRGLAVAMSFVVVILVFITGFLGGLVAHGHSAAPPPSAGASTR